MEGLLDRFESAALAMGFEFLEEKDWPEKNYTNLPPALRPKNYSVVQEMTRDEIQKSFMESGYYPSNSYLCVLSRWRGLGLHKNDNFSTAIFRDYPLQDVTSVLKRGDMYRGFFSEDWWEGRDPEPYRAMLHIMDGNLGGLVTDAKDGSDGPLFNFDEQDHYGEEEPAVFHSLREMFTCLAIALEEGIDIRAGYGPEEREDAHRFATLCLKLLGDRPYWQSAEAYFSKPWRSSLE